MGVDLGDRGSMSEVLLLYVLVVCLVEVALVDAVVVGTDEELVGLSFREVHASHADGLRRLSTCHLTHI